jgi:Mg2+ and Co2+ transporter CorA
MIVRFVDPTGVSEYPVEEIPELLARGDGVVWFDVPSCGPASAEVLLDTFGFHPLAVKDCSERSRTAKVHAYPDHVFVVLHAPERAEQGRIANLELDQFIGPGFLVTVHGPVERPDLQEAAERETQSVLHRIEAGRFTPKSSMELSYAIITALTRQQESVLASLAGEIADLEDKMMGGTVSDPESFLEELFQTRHELLAVRTMIAQSLSIYRRMATLARFVPGESDMIVSDVVDQFERLRSLADGHREFLQGVIEFYRAKTDTKMTIAAERLAVIAAVTLPITALSSIYGMNVIVNSSTHVTQLLIILTVMLIISGWLLRWTKKQGWW